MIIKPVETTFFRYYCPEVLHMLSNNTERITILGLNTRYDVKLTVMLKLRKYLLKSTFASATEFS